MVVDAAPEVLQVPPGPEEPPLHQLVLQLQDLGNHAMTREQQDDYNDINNKDDKSNVYQDAPGAEWRKRTPPLKTRGQN